MTKTTTKMAKTEKTIFEKQIRNKTIQHDAKMGETNENEEQYLLTYVIRNILVCSHVCIGHTM